MYMFIQALLYIFKLAFISIEQYVDYLLKENTKTYTYLDLRGIRDRTENDIDNKE